MPKWEICWKVKTMQNYLFAVRMEIFKRLVSPPGEQSFSNRTQHTYIYLVDLIFAWYTYWIFTQNTNNVPTSTGCDVCVCARCVHVSVIPVYNTWIMEKILYLLTYYLWNNIDIYLIMEFQIACRRGYCYCVDDNGYQISQEVRENEMRTLNCFNNGVLC